MNKVIYRSRSITKDSLVMSRSVSNAKGFMIVLEVREAGFKACGKFSRSQTIQ